MRLVTFTHAGRTRAGVAVDDHVVDLAPHGVPESLIDVLAVDRRRLEDAAGSGRHRIACDDVTLQAPVPRPGKLLGIGLNYADHAAETGRSLPEIPVVFNKQVTCVNRDGSAIVVPRVSPQVDYEGELAFVIGRRCRRVPEGEAASVIAGYTIMNDVSVRDWQRRTPTMTMGKSFDSHGPFGPWIVTADEVGDPHALAIRTIVNDVVVQDSNTAQMVFSCFAIVAHLSEAFTLEPGDVITTGTPAGVGAARTPPLWLRPGDRVQVDIERIGSLRNHVVAECDDGAAESAP